MADLDLHWLERLRAVGRTQSRYLWVLLVAMLFYLAIAHKAEPHSTPIKVPLVELELSSTIIFASGPVVISFLVLAVLGTLRAFDRAAEQLGLGEGKDPRIEAADTYPNAIDMAVYTTPDSPKLVANIVYFTYPLFLTLALVEVVWLWLLLLRQGGPEGRVLFLAAGGILSIFAMWQVGTMWSRRLRKTFDGPPRNSAA